MTGDKSREAEGKLDQAKGDVKDAAGKVKDAAGNLVDRARDEGRRAHRGGRAAGADAVRCRRLGCCGAAPRAPLRTLGYARHSRRAV